MLFEIALPTTYVGNVVPIVLEQDPLRLIMFHCDFILISSIAIANKQVTTCFQERFGVVILLREREACRVHLHSAY